MADSLHHRSLTEAERESLREPQCSARKACANLITDLTVMVFPEGFGPGCSSGSGLLLTTNKKTPFLLTAQHLFDNQGRQTAVSLINESHILDDVVNRVFSGPRRKEKHDGDHEYVDVAAVSLVPTVRDRIREIVRATIATDSETHEDDNVVIAGFPSFLIQGERPTERRLDLHYAPFFHFTGIEGHDSIGRLRVGWNKARVIWEIPEIPHFRIPDTEAVFELESPRGISGGGLWRVRGPISKAEIWTPTSHCQLIGVPVAYKGKIAFAEPVESFRTWLDDISLEIDALAE